MKRICLGVICLSSILFIGCTETTSYIKNTKKVSGVCNKLQACTKADTSYLTLELNQFKDEDAINAYRQEQKTREQTIQQTVKETVLTQTTLTKKHKELLEAIPDYLGIPYVWGGTTKNGMDCSGFVQSIYREIGIDLPRVSHTQALEGETVSRSDLRFGDLLFFDTRNDRDMHDVLSPEDEVIYAKKVVAGISVNKVSHVGIYIGDGYMLHASSGDGYITFSTLNNTYYKSRFLFAKRVI